MRLIDLFIVTALVALSLSPITTGVMRPAGILFAFLPGCYVGVRLACRKPRPSDMERLLICLSSAIFGALSATLIISLGFVASESWTAEVSPLTIIVSVCIAMPLGFLQGGILGGIVALLLGNT
jgi:hypothetical protein